MTATQKGKNKTIFNALWEVLAIEIRKIKIKMTKMIKIIG